LLLSIDNFIEVSRDKSLSLLSINTYSLHGCCQTDATQFSSHVIIKWCICGDESCDRCRAIALETFEGLVVGCALAMDGMATRSGHATFKQH